MHAHVQGSTCGEVTHSMSLQVLEAVAMQQPSPQLLSEFD
jgi:hypothetical protein